MKCTRYKKVPLYSWVVPDILNHRSTMVFAVFAVVGECVRIVVIEESSVQQDKVNKTNSLSVEIVSVEYQ